MIPKKKSEKMIGGKKNRNIKKHNKMKCYSDLLLCEKEKERKETGFQLCGDR